MVLSYPCRILVFINVFGVQERRGRGLTKHFKNGTATRVGDICVLYFPSKSSTRLSEAQVKWERCVRLLTNWNVECVREYGRLSDVSSTMGAVEEEIWLQAMVGLRALEEWATSISPMYALGRGPGISDGVVPPFSSCFYILFLDYFKQALASSPK